MDGYLEQIRQGLYLLPDQVSAYAADVDLLYLGLIGLSAILVAILVAMVPIFGWR